MRDQRLYQKEKDMFALREGDPTAVQHRSHQGALRDYSLKHQVTLERDLNPESIRDKIFILRIDDYEVLLDGEEFIRQLRWV